MHPARRPRTAVRDVLAEAARAVVGRRIRATLTVAGIALGVAAAVATIGVTASAGSAISERFDEAQATMVTVQYPSDGSMPEPSASQRLGTLNGVVHAGLLCYSQADHRVSNIEDPPDDATVSRVSMVAAEPEALAAAGVRVTSGRAFDDGHGSRREPVAIVDRTAARQLGIADGSRSPTVYVDGLPLSVLGIFEAPRGEPRFTNAVVVPYQVCQDDSPGIPGGTAEAVIRTVLGAADQVGDEAPLVLLPSDPSSLTVLVPPDLRTFRTGVEAETRSLFLGLAAVSLVIGALGVSNTTLVSVLERRPEIGLRRAVGASRRAVAAQFLAESILLGLAGGTLGTIIGIDVTAAVVLTRDWLIVIDPILIAAGPAIGLVVGMVAGAYPAWSASRVAPAATLRGL